MLTSRPRPALSRQPQSSCQIKVFLHKQAMDCGKFLSETSDLLQTRFSLAFVSTLSVFCLLASVIYGFWECRLWTVSADTQSITETSVHWYIQCRNALMVNSKLQSTARQSLAHANSGFEINPFYTEWTLLPYVLEDSIFNFRGVRLC